MISNKNTPQSLFLLKDFRDEKEISDFLEKNLSKIFPNLILIESLWKIPIRDIDDNEGTIDALAFYKKKGETERVVLLEYKHNDMKNPVTQLHDYFNTLKRNRGNFEKLEKRYNRHLKTNNLHKELVDWELKTKEEEFWKRRILIAIVPPKLINHNKIREAKEKEVILVKIQKYLDENDKKNGLISVSLEKESNKWKETLGMKAENIIISESKEIISINNTKKLEESTESTELESFLNKKYRNTIKDPTIKEQIKKIDKRIRATNKKIKSKIADGYWVYQKGTTSLISFHYYKPQGEKGEKKLNIFLRRLEKQEIIIDNSRTDFSGGYLTDNFNWRIIIENQKDFKEFLNQFEKYLRETRDKNPTKLTKNKEV